MDYNLLLASVVGIVLLLLLVLRFKLHAFISLLISSIVVGLIAGMSSEDILSSMQSGMGNTLGFVALVVGLGAIFGAILEHSGGAFGLSKYVLNKFGVDKAPWALMLIGFIIAIPVFFDVAVIILMPIVYALQRGTKTSLLYYAIPLLAGLAVTHSFIPPTPGPVAVAEIIDVELGYVILIGFVVGLPVSIICGPIFSRYISNKVFINAPMLDDGEEVLPNSPPFSLLISIILLPILLIVLSTILSMDFSMSLNLSSDVRSIIVLVGHPFIALIIANLLAWHFLGVKLGFSKDQLLKITSKSMAPAGIIILLTGAGGVFKQILVDTGTGAMLAEFFTSIGLTVLFFAFLSALIIRVLQGSATVAMITAAGLTSPLVPTISSGMDKALIVIAIACGASALSHVNDSGFWLVGKYLGMNEKETLKSWTMMTLILSISGFSLVLLISIFV